MSFVARLTLFLLASAAVSALVPIQDKDTILGDKDTILGPASSPDYNPNDAKHFVPNRKVNLYYASMTENTPLAADISFSMRYPTIVLENVASIASVDCSASSLAIKFSTEDGYQKAVAQWDSKSKLLMVTNHFGNCDVNYKRGFFVAESLIWNPKTLVVTASSSKSDIESVAEEAAFMFGKQAAVTSSLDKRWDFNKSISIPVAAALPADETLFSVPEVVTVVADSAAFSGALELSGYLNYNFLQHNVEALYFDVDSSFALGLVVSANVSAEYSANLTYTLPPIIFSSFNIIDVINIGPEVTFGISTDLAVSGAVNLSTTLDISLAKLNGHFDVRNKSNNGFTGWNPAYSTFANISGEVDGSFDPKVDVTLDLTIRGFGHQFGAGITATPGFTNKFEISGKEGVDSRSLSIRPPPAKCGRGVKLTSDLTFELVAFVTGLYKSVLFSTDIPVENLCYNVTM